MTPEPAPLFFSAADVFRDLTYEACIPAVRAAMMAHSSGETRALLRSFIPLGPARTFAQMPAALSERGYFGAKMISVFAEPDDPGRRTHRGIVLVFEGETGRPVAIADAGSVTLIRTAAASAVATEALARSDASRLAILGTGHQAEAHARAIACVRRLESIAIWGRNAERAQALARKLAADGLPATASPGALEAVRDVDIICTVTASAEPVLHGAWLAPGVHVNVVGSSAPGPVEVDHEVVTRARFFGDDRHHVTQHGAEFLRAKEAGLIDDSHLLGEIGDVLNGEVSGRLTADDITVYKSLGHAVQDLAAVSQLYERATGRYQA